LGLGKATPASSFAEPPLTSSSSRRDHRQHFTHIETHEAHNPHQRLQTQAHASSRQPTMLRVGVAQASMLLSPARRLAGMAPASSSSFLHPGSSSSSSSRRGSHPTLQQVRQKHRAYEAPFLQVRACAWGRAGDVDGMLPHCVCTNLSFCLVLLLAQSFHVGLTSFHFPLPLFYAFTHQARKANYQPLSPLSFLERTAKLYPRRTAVAYR
jgi:hypothetical protein